MEHNPYVGPRAFDINESDTFFGREEETEILQGLVMSRRVVLLFAKSGVGKSSLVRAGLIPRLTAERSVGRGRRARQLPPKMTVLPIATVGGALPAETSPNNVYSFIALYSMQPDADSQALASQTLTQGLAGLIGDDGNSPQDNLPVLLVLDQFEELFTRHLTRWEDREGFFRQVSQALDQYPTLHVLFVMREDYIAEMTPYANLIPGRLETDYRVERLNKDAALNAVQHPADGAGCAFAEGVAEGLVDNLRRIQVKQSITTSQTSQPDQFGEYVEPVHLQIVCRQLWASLPADRTSIEDSDVQAFGDVDEALTNFYESTLQAVLHADTTDISERRLRNWFDHNLITPARTKGLVYRGEDETEGLPNEAVDILNEAWIIRADKRGSDTWYELAHDRLVEPILAANQAWHEKFQNPLTRAAEAWIKANKDPKMLYKGGQLDAALAEAKENPDELTGAETEFLEASQMMVQAQAARRQRFMFIGAAGLIIIFAGLAIWALLNATWASKERDNANQARAAAQTEGAKAKIAEGNAKQQTHLADALRLAVQSQNVLATHPQRSLLLAIEALTATLKEEDPRVVPEAEQILRQGLATTGGLFLSNNINDVQFSPNDRWLVSTDGESEYRLWDLNDLTQEATVLAGHKGKLSDLTAMTSDGHRFVVAGEKEAVWLWDLSNPNEEPEKLSGHQGPINNLAVTPDNQWLITVDSGAGQNGPGKAKTPTVRLWDLADLTASPLKLTGHDWPINTIGLSPGADSRWLVTADTGGEGGAADIVITPTIRLWDLNAPVPNTETFILGGHDKAIDNLVISSDNQWLVSTSEDTVNLWNLAGDDPTARVLMETKKDDAILKMAISPDSRWLVTVNLGPTSNQARLWDLTQDNPGQTPIFLDDHAQPINDLVITSDSKWLVTVSYDSTARVWNLTADNPAAQPIVLSGHQAPINKVVLTTDDRWLVTAGQDHTIQLWDLTTVAETIAIPLVLKGHENSISKVNISPNNRWLVSTGGDNIARIWDLSRPADSSSANPIVLTGHEAAVTAVAVSLDNRWLATGSLDGTARLWGLNEPTQPPLTLAGHEEDVSALTFSNDSQWLATAGAGKTIWLWNVTGADPTTNPITLTGHNRAITVLDFSDDGHQLVAGSRGKTVFLWNLDDPTAEPLTLGGHQGKTAATTISSDNELLITRDDRAVHVWNLNQTDPTATSLALPGDQKNSDDFFLSTTNTWLVDTSGGNVVRIWNLRASELTDDPITLSGHKGLINAAAVTPDDHWLVTGGEDKTVRLWDLRLPELIELACRTAGRNLTLEEWEQYFPQQAEYHLTCPDLPEPVKQTGDERGNLGGK